MEAHVSDIVLSLSGRDKGLTLLVVSEDEKFLYLANGRGRRGEKPKKKRRRHVSYQGTSDARTQEKLRESGRLNNSEIRKALDLWTCAPRMN